MFSNCEKTQASYIFDSSSLTSNLNTSSFSYFDSAAAGASFGLSVASLGLSPDSFSDIAEVAVFEPAPIKDAFLDASDFLNPTGFT
tara:strand:+ start:139 stop:396 length:258 start_codon:yes stop_codon:yes gene_type:complete